MKKIGEILILMFLLPLMAAEAREKVTELPEVMVESPRRNMLHVLAYVREYSMLSTYSDTVSLFREKLVDFMIPGSFKTHYKGWRIPRVIKSESYYRFTNAEGLDSVSATSHHHFSWSDWMGLPPNTKLPEQIVKNLAANDTVFGKYSPVEIYGRKKDLVNVEINVLADTMGRRWTPNLGAFFRDGNLEFEDFKIKLVYDNVLGNTLKQTDLKKFVYRVDARGRGHDMFRFNRKEEEFFATTDGELYVLDMEYITEKEAKKWGGGKYDTEDLQVIRSADAPELSRETLALIDRVEHIDQEAVRLDGFIDRNMIRMERKRNWGQGAIRYLKNILGISDAMAGKKHKRDWNKFRDSRKK
ncbi:MAG: hypothetical protein NC095_01845 [Muribaculum sp.]|nr:hypothetical protein [Muribaculum sp.]